MLTTAKNEISSVLGLSFDQLPVCGGYWSVRTPVHPLSSGLDFLIFTIILTTAQNPLRGSESHPSPSVTNLYLVEQHKTLKGSCRHVCYDILTLGLHLRVSFRCLVSCRISITIQCIRVNIWTSRDRRRIFKLRYF